MIDRRRMNLFDTIEFYGHDIDFEPHELPEDYQQRLKSKLKCRSESWQKQNKLGLSLR